MKPFFTALLLIGFVLSVTAGDLPQIKLHPKALTPAKRSAKVNPKFPVEPLFPTVENASAPIHNTGRMRINKATAATTRQIGTSGNGYGWLNPLTRGVDRWAGTDVDLGGSIDYVMVGYRGADASQIMETEVDVSAGLASGTVYNSDPLNTSINPFGVGGRYPCVVADERPFVAYNQYKEGDVTNTPALSHAYLNCSWGTYGANGNLWTSPDFMMDDGWLNPTVAGFVQYQENRLWNGPVSVVKDAQSTWHYIGVYETWFSDIEDNLYGTQNEKHIIVASSPDDFWGTGWTRDVNPIEIDYNTVSLPRCGVMMNSSGFGVIAGPGHLGWHNPDSGYYYQDIRITYSVTSDFGHTWSAWDTVSFAGLGFPMYHHPEDKLLIVSINGTDTTWYDGPTFMGSNFDMDVLVDENGYTYVGFNSLWGRPGDSGWYPSAYYSGKFMARRDPDGTWGAARIWYPNGAFSGDNNGGDYFFDSEIDMAIDDQGNLYAAWLDRRRTDSQLATYNRYTDPGPSGASLNPDYITDVYAAHSIDGGASWSDPINCTDTPTIDEYELNLARNAANQTARGDYGKIWFGYCVADVSSADPNEDAYIEVTNAVWLGEAANFNPPAAVESEAEQITRSYALQQNYPNPFNPTTRIEFVPLQSGKAQISVYNSKGQLVDNIFDARVVKGKAYHVDYDASHLAAGVYFYRLINNQRSEVKKMVLVK